MSQVPLIAKLIVVFVLKVDLLDLQAYCFDVDDVLEAFLREHFCKFLDDGVPLFQLQMHCELVTR